MTFRWKATWEIYFLAHLFSSFILAFEIKVKPLSALSWTWKSEDLSVSSFSYLIAETR